MGKHPAESLRVEQYHGSRFLLPFVVHSYMVELRGQSPRIASLPRNLLVNEGDHRGAPLGNHHSVSFPFALLHATLIAFTGESFTN